MCTCACIVCMYVRMYVHKSVCSTRLSSSFLIILLFLLLTQYPRNTKNKNSWRFDFFWIGYQIHEEGNKNISKMFWFVFSNKACGVEGVSFSQKVHQIYRRHALLGVFFYYTLNKSLHILTC